MIWRSFTLCKSLSQYVNNVGLGQFTIWRYDSGKSRGIWGVEPWIISNMNEIDSRHTKTNDVGFFGESVKWKSYDWVVGAIYFFYKKKSLDIFIYTFTFCQIFGKMGRLFDAKFWTNLIRSFFGKRLKLK